MTATVHALIDGALYCDPRTERQRIVEDMAGCLVQWHAFGCEADAFMSLIYAQKPDGSQRYDVFTVSSCFRDAIAEAQQIVVAREMGGS